MKNASKSIFSQIFENFRKSCLFSEKRRGVSGRAVTLSLRWLKKKSNRISKIFLVPQKSRQTVGYKPYFAVQPFFTSKAFDFDDKKFIKISRMMPKKRATNFFLQKIGEDDNILVRQDRKIFFTKNWQFLLLIKKIKISATLDPQIVDGDSFSTGEPPKP